MGNLASNSSNELDQMAESKANSKQANTATTEMLPCVMVLGSSVALGAGATKLRGKFMHGWASRLAERLESSRVDLLNYAVSGSDTKACMQRWKQIKRSKLKPPTVIIIGLSLANEGLPFSEHWEDGLRIVQKSFIDGLKALKKDMESHGCKVAFGGVYPFGNYTSEQYDILKDTHEQMKEWDNPLIDFLSTTDDGRGHWKPDSFCDPGHPNDLGHELMYNAITDEFVEWLVTNVRSYDSSQSSEWA